MALPYYMTPEGKAANLAVQQALSAYFTSKGLPVQYDTPEAQAIIRQVSQQAAQNVNSNTGVNYAAAGAQFAASPSSLGQQPASSPAATQPAAYSGPFASQSQIASALQQRFAYAAAYPPTAPAVTPTTSSPTATSPTTAAANTTSTLAPGQRMQSGINPAMIDPQYRPSGPIRTPGAALTPGGSDTVSPSGAAATVPPRGQSGFWADYYANGGNQGAGYSQRPPGVIGRLSTTRPAPTGQLLPRSSAGLPTMGSPPPANNYPSSLGLGNYYMPYKMGQAQTMNTGAANANFLGSYSPRY